MIELEARKPKCLKDPKSRECSGQPAAPTSAGART